MYDPENPSILGYLFLMKNCICFHDLPIYKVVSIFVSEHLTIFLMALTNYRAYKWLIDLLDEYPDQRYGMSLKQINNAYERDYYNIYNSDIQSDKKRQGITGVKKVFLKDQNEEVTLTYKTLINWRNAIWKEFGLIIWHPVIKKTVNRIINGVKKEVEEETTSNTYIIVNKALLDENKTLRETLEHLVEDEQRGYVNESPFVSHVKGRPKSAAVKAATMGFITVGNGGEEYPDRQFGYEQEPDMVDTIRFSMNLGEALVIKRGSKNMILESQELKCINGRWYVIGNLHDYDDCENSRLAILDVQDIRISEDEDVTGDFYKVVKGFEDTHLIPWDWKNHFKPDTVVSIYLKARGNAFEKQPFCDTQMKIKEISGGVPEYIYKVYVKPDKNFILRYLACENHQLIVCEAPEDIMKSDTDINGDQIQYLRKIRRTAN